MSSSKDGSIAVYEFADTSSPSVSQEKVLEEVCHFYPKVEGKTSKPSAIIAAKWLGEKIAMSLLNGSVVEHSLEANETKLLSFYEFNPIHDMEIVNGDVFVTCDSG